MSALVVYIDQKNPRALKSLGDFAVLALKLWELILMRNRGSTYDYVLDQLPYAKEEIFVDAASSWGIGGLFGDRYFLFPNSELEIFQNVYNRCKLQSKKRDLPSLLPIPYLELLAAVIAMVCFIPYCNKRIIRLNSDSTDAVAWLEKSRCRAGIGFRMLAVIELYKHKFGVKISTHHIRGVANRSADSLSRGVIPLWLQKFGIKMECNLDHVANLLDNPLPAWRKILQPRRS